MAISFFSNIALLLMIWVKQPAALIERPGSPSHYCTLKGMEDLVSGVHIVGVFYLEDIERLLFQQQAAKREKGSKNVSW